MTARYLESRIVKLETRTARPDEILVVWRKPDGDIAEALKGATFAKGDKVICAEWFDDSRPPSPRWYKDRLRSAMDRAEYEQIERTIERMEIKSGLAGPCPGYSDARVKEMTDEELIHAILGVD